MNQKGQTKKQQKGKMIRVESGQGTQVGQRAQPEQVTHIKWMVNDRIPAGSEKILSFRVVVK